MESAKLQGIFLCILSFTCTASALADVRRYSRIHAESRMTRVCYDRKICVRLITSCKIRKGFFVPCLRRKHFPCRRRIPCQTMTSTPSIRITPSVSTSAFVSPSASASTTPSASASVSVTPSSSPSPSTSSAFQVSSGPLDPSDSPHTVFLDMTRVSEGDTVQITNFMITGGSVLESEDNGNFFLFSGPTCTPLEPVLGRPGFSIPVQVGTVDGRIAVQLAVSTGPVPGGSECPEVRFSFDVVEG